MGVGGPIGCFIECTPQEFLARARDFFHVPENTFVIGGGSNLVASDNGFPGTVIRFTGSDVAVSGITGSDETESPQAGTTPRDIEIEHVTLRAPAGIPWDELVCRAIDLGCDELSPMSGVPGSFGGAIVQNISAYGASMHEVLSCVELYDADTDSVVTLSLEDMQYGYRTSILKNAHNKIVLFGTLLLKRGPARITHKQLASALKVNIGELCSGKSVKEAVLRIRGEKGMLTKNLVPSGLETCNTASVGSFFVNPVVPGESVNRLQDLGLPIDLTKNSSVAQTDEAGNVKISAAFLIEQSGFQKGFSIPNSRAAISTQHALAIVNKGGATATEVIELARLIANTVCQKYGIRLVPEPVLIGLEL